jgi:hypothetical protein
MVGVVRGVDLARTRFLYGPITALTIAAMTTGMASAQMADNAVQVAGRVVSFLQPAPSGAIIAAIIYRPGDAVSVNEARAIERALGSGLMVGSLRLKPKRVAIG